MLNNNIHLAQKEEYKRLVNIFFEFYLRTI